MRVLIGLTLSATLTSCVGFSSLDATYTPVQSAQSTTTQSQQELMQVYSRYKGTPYRYGGTNANGFDCSGFIQTVFNEAYGFSTPRTTDQLARSGTPIRRDQLQVGDVLIFRSSIKQLHAGIYVGNNQFIHASTSQGVTQSRLDNSYWLQRFVRARRYL
jgi:lipoprotein Spr/probable lipoprotein NlpC